MFYEGINAKVFRHSIAFAIAVVVTLFSSSFEYSMLEHAVHAGTERNVCNIVVSTETPQTSPNTSQTLLPVYKLAHFPLSHPKSSPPRPPQPLAQTFAQMRNRCKYQVSSTDPKYHLSTRIYALVPEILSLIACVTTQISLHIFKVSTELSCTDTYIYIYTCR